MLRRIFSAYSVFSICKHSSSRTETLCLVKQWQHCTDCGLISTESCFTPAWLATCVGTVCVRVCVALIHHSLVQAQKYHIPLPYLSGYRFKFAAGLGLLFWAYWFEFYTTPMNAGWVVNRGLGLAQNSTPAAGIKNRNRSDKYGTRQSVTLLLL